MMHLSGIGRAIAVIILVTIFSCITWRCAKNTGDSRLIGRWELINLKPKGLELKGKKVLLSEYRVDFARDTMSLRLVVQINNVSKILSMQTPWNFDGRQLKLKNKDGGDITIPVRVFENNLQMNAHVWPLVDLVFYTNGNAAEKSDNKIASDVLREIERLITPPLNLVRVTGEPVPGDLSGSHRVNP